MENLPVFRPLLEDEEIGAALESLRLGWLGMGSFVDSFERAVHSYVYGDGFDVPLAVGVSTGHAAIHLSLRLMGVGQGDEVITPSFNNVADFQAIRACGAEPVFVDIDPVSLCVNPESIADVATSCTKAIIGMDYAMNLCDHEALNAISHELEIPILHDAAHSFGSSFNGQPVGNQHPLTIFSFDPVKSLTCIDGGVIVCRDPNSVQTLHEMRLIGMTQASGILYRNTRAWTYDVRDLGFRYHLANLHAAIGVAQIKKIDLIRRTRQYVARRYSEALSHVGWLDVPAPPGADVMPFIFVVRVKGGLRARFIEFLKSKGIDTGIHWQPGHLFSFFNSCRRGDLSVTEQVSQEILTLPMYSKMSDSEIDRVVEAVREFVP